MQAKVEAFIARWQGREGGQERANYALFLSELASVLDLPRPDPASASHDGNDYVFERVVRETARDGTVSNKRIDLYKRDCFILEAKQSRFSGDKKLADAPADAPAGKTRGRRGAERAWDVLMLNARRQAEDYVRLLPPDHEPPPFVLVCDVGHCIEVYANFRRDGKAYDQFPDRAAFRIYLEDLREDAVRRRLAAIWTEPMSLDPSRHAARVTRNIAARLAEVSKTLEEGGQPPERVAMFLMRVLFTMFAEDVGLLPQDSFKSLLKECEAQPQIFPAMLEDLWKAMDEGGFTATIKHQVRRFNGEFFKNRTALALDKGSIGDLRAAAEYDWRDVEPAIFGTLLEQALDAEDRRRLGAHYTPRVCGTARHRHPHRSPAGGMGAGAVHRRAPEDGWARRRGGEDGAGLPRQAVRHPGAGPGLRHRQLPLCGAGADEAPGRRGAGGGRRPWRTGSPDRP
jgi:hypothetical protein